MIIFRSILQGCRLIVSASGGGHPSSGKRSAHWGPSLLWAKPRLWRASFFFGLVPSKLWSTLPTTATSPLTSRMCSRCWWGRVSCSCRASKTPAARSSENGEVMWWAWPMAASRPFHFWNPLPVCWVLRVWKVLRRRWAGKMTAEMTFLEISPRQHPVLWDEPLRSRIYGAEPALSLGLTCTSSPGPLSSLTSHRQIWSASPNCSTAVPSLCGSFPCLTFLAFLFPSPLKDPAQTSPPRIFCPL